MTLVELLPWIAGAAFVAFGLKTATGGGAARRGAWMFPAALSALFLAWSASAVVAEGPFGFWTEHTRGMWGNQIWFDLLLAVGVGWFLVVPQAKAMGMRVVPWFLLILCTGSIGLLAMISRFLYLREHPENRSAA